MEPTCSFSDRTWNDSDKNHRSKITLLLVIDNVIASTDRAMGLVRFHRFRKLPFAFKRYGNYLFLQGVALNDTSSNAKGLSIAKASVDRSNLNGGSQCRAVMPKRSRHFSEFQAELLEQSPFATKHVQELEVLEL